MTLICCMGRDSEWVSDVIDMDRGKRMLIVFMEADQQSDYRGVVRKRLGLERAT